MPAIEADLSGAIWSKSTRSNNGGNCLTEREVATRRRGCSGLQGSARSRLVFTPAGWQAFTASIQAS
jgi:hypothetical protein